jgi:hypothetical protein
MQEVESSPRKVPKEQNGDKGSHRSSVCAKSAVGCWQKLLRNAKIWISFTVYRLRQIYMNRSLAALDRVLDCIGNRRMNNVDLKQESENDRNPRSVVMSDSAFGGIYGNSPGLLLISPEHRIPPNPRFTPGNNHDASRRTILISRGVTAHRFWLPRFGHCRDPHG